MPNKKQDDERRRPDDHRLNAEAERLKHGHTSKDETGAPKGKNRANAGEETS
jgi:hypothetical protein